MQHTCCSTKAAAVAAVQQPLKCPPSPPPFHSALPHTMQPWGASTFSPTHDPQRGPRPSALRRLRGPAYAALALLGLALLLLLGALRYHGRPRDAFGKAFPDTLVDVALCALLRCVAGLAFAAAAPASALRRRIAVLCLALAVVGAALCLAKLPHRPPSALHTAALCVAATAAALETALLALILWSKADAGGYVYAPLPNPCDVDAEAPPDYKSWRLMALAVPELRWLIAGCVALFVRLPFSLALPHFVSATIGALIDGDVHAVRAAILCFVGAGVVDACLDFWCVFLFGYTQQRIIRRLRLNLFGSLLYQVPPAPPPPVQHVDRWR